MGGKSGGGQSTPYEAPNTLSSAQSLRIIDAISEGVVSGFANGDDAPFKSVFFDDTPVQNADGSFNYKGVVGFFQRGLQEQTYVPGFDASERTVAVSAGVKQNTPIVRTVTDALVTRLRITVGVERNAAVQDNGDTLPANTSLQVELVNNQGVKAGQVVAFTEKGSGIYYQDVLFDTLPAAPFNIRVTRISPDSTTDRISNNTYFASYVEIIDAKLSYPHTAFAALAIDSDQFGNSVPRRNYLLKGRLVKVPSNYDPETRVYSGTTWDGSFKTAWTNNPAWVFYDVLTQPRFSTLARRLNVADIDKWSLYQIGRYCDELVDDGFGGKEPRFICNAYISDLTQAGEFLLNLASVFTGLPVWNGSQISVVMDADSDPVALYNNSNVKDGLFTYSGAAYKSIHTAVHVQYIDKYDGYRTKTEYIADNDAVARYGLNIKQITAFGCDSRGQAARFGAWTLQTELRQQNMVSFEVGREGLKHLPYDIVQVMDNQYAGAELSGRITAVDGLTVTLDRDVPDIAGALFYYSGSDGLKSVKVAGWPAKNQAQLESADGISAGAGWAVGGKVKPRLYRAIGIKENSSDGTYTITGLLHDPKKYAAVDSWANFDREITTLHNIAPVLVNGNIATKSGAVVISWDNLTASGQVLTYDIKIYRNNRLYRHTPDAKTAEIRLENLPNGDYRAEIRGRNARGSLSEPLIKAWSVDYNITGLRATPKTLAIAVDWVLPQTVVSELVSELWYSRSNDFKTAVKLASLPYPQNSYQLTGVGVSDTYYFWARAIDTAGNSGELTAAVKGQADKDPAPIVAQVQGAITKSALSKDLIASLNADMATAADGAKQAAIRDAAAKIAAETQQRTQAIQAEAATRTTAIKIAADKAAADLTKAATDLGTKITAVENVNATQAQQISTVTAAQGQTAAGLEAEKKTRADGDTAEASKREALAVRTATAEGSIIANKAAQVSDNAARVKEINALGGRVGTAESAINTLRETVTKADEARATEIKTLQAAVNAGGNLHPDSEFKYGFDYQYSDELTGAVQLRLNHSVYAVPGKNIVFLRRAVIESRRNPEFGSIRVQKGKVYQVSALVMQKGTATAQTSVYGRILDDSRAWRGDDVKIKDVGEVARHDSSPFEWSRFVRCGQNIEIGENATATQLCLALSAGVTTSADVLVQMLAEPMICEVASLDSPLVPYSPGYDPVQAVAEAAFAEYKSAQVTKEEAQTKRFESAESKIAGNVASITNLQTTKADANQVVTMARTALSAEWTKAATDAAAKAQRAAAADAKKYTDAESVKTRASIELLQETTSEADEARATEIKTLRASLNAGGNLIPDSEFKYGMAYQMSGELNTDTRRLGFNLSAMRSIAGKKVGYLRRMEALPDDGKNNFNIEFARIAVEAGKTYQFSLYVQRHDNQISRTTIYSRPLVGGAWNATGVTIKAINNNTPAATNATTTLGVMTRLVINVAVAADAPTEQMSLALNCGVCTDAKSRYVFFTQPMICEVSSLDAEPVPYSPGPDPVQAVTEADFTEYKRVEALKDAATATEVKRLAASVGGGANLLENSEFLLPGARNIPMGYTFTKATGVNVYHNLVNSIYTYALKDTAETK